MLQHHKTIWKELLDNEYNAYLKSGNGKDVFSIEGYEVAEKVGKEISSRMKGTCLDIGCGLLPKPSYMKGSVKYVGIDPLRGGKRDFLFTQAIGEEIPFKDSTFDGALFGTSLEHTISPAKALSEVWRVLKEKGKLFVWFTERDTNYKPYPYDKLHQWGFDKETLIVIVKKIFHVDGVRTISSSFMREKLLIGTKQYA